MPSLPCVKSPMSSHHLPCFLALLIALSLLKIIYFCVFIFCFLPLLLLGMYKLHEDEHFVSFTFMSLVLSTVVFAK